MQIYKTVPTNKEFFKRYGKYTSFIAWGIVLSQIISGLTESGLIYSNIRDSTKIFGYYTSNIAGITGAILGVLLIELIGLRVALTGAIDAFLYRRWKGLDKLFSIALIVLTLILVPSSFFLSYQGGGQIVDNLQDKTALKAKIAIEGKETTALTAIKTTTQTTIQSTKESYTKLRNSIEQNANAELLVLQQKYDYWSSKGENYKSRINKALIALQQRSADKTKRIAELIAAEAKELKEINANYQKEVAATKSEFKESKNTTSNKIQNQSNTFKAGSNLLVIVAMFFSIIGIILQRIYLKGSGIEELAEANNFYFAPSLLSEKWKLYQDFKQIEKRNDIAEQRAKLPKVVPYTSKMPIYDLEAVDRTVFQLKLEETEEEDNTIYLTNDNSPTPTTDLIELEQQIQAFTDAQIQLEAKQNDTAAKQMELKAKQVIRLYLERNNRKVEDTNILDFQNRLIEHIYNPNKYHNPFDEYRKPIGFDTPKNTPPTTDSTPPIQSTYNGDRTDTNHNKICAYCSTGFSAKHWNAKYCGDRCRIAAWEQRTGKKFKKKPKGNQK